ncbi:high affinity cAMP-specific and IBMX-insensitive 3',5'-cyclic phosphodiesterase 8 isoform X1 [Bombyx mandarina]|uniref:PDEase domain-containing protein n=2 Tax=Bombyx TaxID=7090 RepID=A0A8R2R4I2_BOMMO|nr:high affinity cAMP-specific and IBMX-insensitive 3',5'-cyclic phosphodiesterase 8 isoform X1 [Bombyx mandarina]XP_037873423.1 high affinity cAMP-specific and IBMX-insensitive 3',5'-cyclic phosphodiesterase 8 isoform X5 [Bombyx mori]XP_037873424.1 high affinity cAMP-specific and IBMX-insensitive 3',5'-cyclic phosphodiesterase 8 isoform X5 [Bombyx mori]
MGCTPSMLLDHKNRRRDSTGSQEAALAKVAPTTLCNKAVQAARAPRASLESDGFSIQLSSKKDSYVSQMGNNFATQLHIKRISGSSSGSPGARAGRRSSLALTPEDEPLVDVTNRSPPPANIPTALIYSPPEPLELLCVFPERTSRVCAAACSAVERAGGEARSLRCARETLDALRRDNDTRVPHVIVVDARQPQQLDALLLARAIRGTKNTQHVYLIAIVKKSAYLKDEFGVLAYLEAGFNRVMVETVNTTAWCAEVLQARSSAACSRAQIAATAALAAAADRCRDLVAITDDQQRILLTNKSWCRMLGWRLEEGPRPIHEAAGGEALRLATTGARDWEAPVTLRRRAAPDPIMLPCRGATIGLTKTTSHIVFVCEPSAGEGDRGRGSLHSIRRGSLDVRSVASDGLRRTSLAKLQGLPLEAPITKVISLLSAATEGAPPSTVACIERAVDMLRTSELYSPQMRDETKLRVEDPIATDLIGALLSREQVNQNLVYMQGNANVLSSRRSSNDSTVVRSQTNRTNIKHKTTGQLRELLDTALSWDFEIFRLEDLTRGRPLAHLGLALMGGRFDVCAALECDERTLLHWLTVIETNYHAVNTYHNSTHAADVLQAVAYFLEKDRLKNLLEPVEAAAALISAAAHDIDHPGTSSAFLCNARHPLAILYNDVSVLESHHAALTFKLTLNDDRVNIFKNLDRDTYKTVRHHVIDMILATEMTKHFEHLAKFVNVFYAKSSGSKEDGMHTDEPLSLDTTALSQPENVLLVKRMMIKCADVSNASRPQKFAMEWARRIAEEYFLQTDEEKAKDLPVVMPMFDRATCSIPRSQIGFIDYIIIDMMEAWAAFIDMPELVNHARSNNQHWRELDEAGVTTLADVKRVQRQNAIQAPPTTTAEPTTEE